ncbi:MAG: sensor histidine kinase [Eggerthellaceae bacterium]|nr:sensor histidine kinase [Eggerthellaceae bacterium]
MSSRDWTIDAVIAVAAFLLGCAQLSLSNIAFVVQDEDFRTMIGVVNVTPSLSSYLMLGLTTWPLVLRRKFPWPVLVFTFIAYVVALVQVKNVSAYTLAFFGPMIALFTVAHERPRLEAFIAAVACVAVLAFVEMPFGLNASLVLLSRIQNCTYVLVAVFAGVALSIHDDYVAVSEERARAAELQREEEAARRVQQERVAIAREIHDITAHSLTAVGIQAAAAEKMIDRDPEAAKEVIVQVRDTSKKALEEIRSMIGVLRNEEQDAETAPTQGTDRLEDLANYAREAGLAVTLDIAAYDKDKVPAYVDVALFGIAREAVTNAVRHAQANNLGIMLSSSSEHARLIVEDDGVGAETTASGGHGVQGMGERVRALGGTFSAHNRARGGFRVEANVPLGVGMLQASR